MSTPRATAFVGRVDELQRLHAAAAALTRGESSLVLVEGEAGAGKTRLLAEITQAPLLSRGHAVAMSGALDYARTPYAPVRDLLLALDKRYPKVLKNNRVLCAALSPVLESKPVDDVEGAQQRRVLDAVVEAIGKFSALAPVVLAVEDIHWIDRASADVLVHLVRNLATLRILLLVSFRGADAQDDEQARYLLGQLGRAATMSLTLAPLSRLDALVLIEDVATAALAMDVRRQISDLAEGNPLLLIEFTKLACEDPQALRGSLPLSLKALVAERLARFNDTDIDVLRVAAVMGEFDPAMLEEIARVPAQQVVSTLRKARSASIIGERRSSGAPFIFRHALIRHAITEDLLAIEAADLHRRIGERLESSGTADNARLAHHFWHARESEKSQRYNELAADEAFKLFAFSDAATSYQRAIDGRPPCEEIFDLYRRWSEACARGHRSPESLTITEQLFAYAIAAADDVRIAEMGFELSRRRYALLDDEGAVEAVERAIECIDTNAYPAGAFNLHATLAWYLAHLRRVEPGKSALQRAQALMEHGEPQSLVRYHEASAALKVHGERDLTYREDLERAIAIAHGIGPHFEVRRLNNFLALSLASNLDDMVYTLQLCDRIENIAPQCSPSQAALQSTIVAWPRFLYGDFAGAARVLSAPLTVAEDSPMIAFQIARTGIPLALHLEDPLLLRRCARPRLLETAFASNTPNVYAPLAASVSEQLRAQGREGEAHALIDQAVKRLPSAMNAIQLIIEAARARASDALERGMRLLEEIAGVSRSASAAFYLCKAYCARGEERASAALQASRTFREILWRVYEAEALELAGERTQALELYRAFGSVAAVRRLETSERRRTGSGLSGREWQVAQLVAQGKSNRSIASELVLSERTVENHIASIFTKLNVGSRAEIAATIARSEVEAV